MNSFPAWIQRIETFEIPNCLMDIFFWSFWCCEYFLTRTHTVFNRLHSTEKTRTIYVPGEAKSLELLSWSSDSVIIDKSQQVSYKPSSLLFGMLNTKEGKNALAVTFCSSERGLLWLGSQLVLFHPSFALRSRFSSYRKTFAANARLGNPWRLYQPVHIKLNSPCTAILRSATNSLRFTLCCKSVP